MSSRHHAQPRRAPFFSIDSLLIGQARTGSIPVDYPFPMFLSLLSSLASFSHSAIRHLLDVSSNQRPPHGAPTVADVPAPHHSTPPIHSAPPVLTTWLSPQNGTIQLGWIQVLAPDTRFVYKSPKARQEGQQNRAEYHSSLLGANSSLSSY